MTDRIFTPEEIALLGTNSDRMIAVKLKVTTAIVSFERRSRGIPKYGAKEKPQKTTNRQATESPCQIYSGEDRICFVCKNAITKGQRAYFFAK